MRKILRKIGQKKKIAAWKENIVKTAAFSMAIKILYK